ncbi:piggyBac transposable element-derived protein 3 [Trichonephila clavata]|uniref:PiggyBac transposable element-derived protein 3 n=1 Tax=Trichonephila clavata TaxID=2740835 RepID=A0A8X6IFV6_TRICU|nr:piggyBac transposable element-derived protein 3 [Trichonephila clavata]
MSRKNLPKLTDDKNLTPGEFDWAVSDENVTCIKWKDKRMEVIRSLVVMGKEGTSKKRKLSSPVQMKAHKFSVPGDVRLANAQHLPVKSTSKRCTVCSTKTETQKNPMDVSNM